MWLGPIFRRELSAEARGRRPYLIRSLAASAVAIRVAAGSEMFGAWSEFEQFSPTRLAHLAGLAFEEFAQIQLVVVLAMVPALVAGSVAEESSRGTLGLLLASRLGSVGIVASKLASRLLLVLVTMLAVLPVLALIGMLGGVDPVRLLGYYGETVAAAWFASTLSMVVSVHARSVAGSVAGAYAAVLGWVFLPIGLVGVLGPSGTPSPLAWLRPIALEVARSSPLSMAYPREVWGLWPWSVRMEEMATLQATAGLVLFALAAWRLRPAYRSRFDARPARLRGWLARVAGLRGRPRPPVGDDPVLWKEFHAPESAGLARWIVLIGLGLVAYMTINDLRWNLAHRLYAWEELFRYGLDPGPWGIHLHARNGMNYVLSEKAATLAGVALAASAVLAAAGVAGERARGTWDGLLATPIDRASILRAKMLGAAWAVRWLVGLAVLTYLLSLASTALHPIGFVLATSSLAVFV
jgi:ABC-type transport system involved in multi-copper enzyme maturation permease subunit